MTTLSHAIEGYVRHLEESYFSDSHVSSVRSRLSRFAAGRETRPLTDITPADIHRYFLALEHSGLASGTLAGHKSTHRAFWRWCKKRKLIKKNPSNVLTGNKDHKYNFKPVNRHAADAADLQRVLQSLEAFAAHRNYNPRDVRDAALVSLVADSSSRRGEIWNLRRKAVQEALRNGRRLADGRIVYHAQSKGKTGAVTVRFFEQTADLLTRWLAVMPSTAVYLFVNLRTGERLEVDALRLGFNRICRFVGVRPFLFQAVRKRDVTDLIEVTGDPKMGQLYANHADARTTQEYYNDLDQHRVDEAAAELAAQRRARPDDLAAVFFDLDRRP